MNRKRAIALVIGEIIIFLAALIICCFRTPDVYYYHGSDLQTTSGMMGEDQTLYLTPTGSEAVIGVYTPTIRIKPGCYRVDFTYETESDDNYYAFQHEYYSYYLLHYDEGIALDSKNTTQTAHFRTYYSIDDFQTRVLYNNEGNLSISSIRITQTKEFDIWACILLLVLFTLVDGILLAKRAIELRKTTGNMTSNFAIQPWQVILLITAIACLPLLSAYMTYGHDLKFHLLRIEGIKDGLLSGQFPVRIHPTHMNGYGYPTSIYYPDLFLYFPALLRLTGLSVVNSYKIFLAVLNLATAYVSYRVFASFSKNKQTGLVGSAIYTLSLYRCVNIYFRSAVGESIAMIFVPVLLLGIYRIISAEKKDYLQLKKGTLLFIIGCTGIIQSHILSCEMVGIFTVLLCLFYVKRIFSDKRILYLLAGLGSTIVLNLGFIVPFLQYMRLDININYWEKKDIMVDSLNLVQIFFPFPKIAGYSEPLQSGMTEDMPFGIGFIFTLGILSIIFHWKYWKKLCKEQHNYGMVCFILAMIAIWMTTYFFPWPLIDQMGGLVAKVMNMVQFPWRYLGLATIFLTFTQLILYQSLKSEKIRKYIYLAVLCYSVFIGVLFAQKYFENEYQVWYYDSEGLAQIEFKNLEYLYKNTDASEANENSFNAILQDSTISFDKKGTNVSVYISESVPLERTYMLPMFYYPCYEAYDVATKEKITTQLGGNNKLQLVIPASYEGTIKVHVKEQPLWMLSNIVSLAAASFFLYYVWRMKKKEKGK